ncbi:thiamine pyrophosphate-dependent enzyme [Halochromatium glycolicum]|jgi:2-oxoglutarate ferredoxin oxidoreductase subunit beta|uniref:2-oxoglutarate synthase n=1 Tax=Halochromatium glycolicum TaxID=85075 RepID=A0AAJ0XBL4_9GAMM|nr:thiamine pyrophosphate-dependent enzyme [Halochromatium glycolicum]MBK1706533.1 2-oxoglutarate synthase [Halochromatium glycolicum]
MSATTTPTLRARDYLSDIKPIWCPGCGHFGVLSALTKALAYLERPKEDTAVISGIGCSSRLPAYLDCYGFHGLHGRALPLATGLKVARPDLTVIVAGGDGDGFSIGGNHFLHACRRNIDLCYIVMDNAVYGMTKGQASPTTPPDWTRSPLTPNGPGIPVFRPAAIALAAGAGFIARGFSGDPHGLSELIARAILHPGFAFVHVLSPCRTFRPDDQSDWKQGVHPFTDRARCDAEAVPALRVDDDGMGIGVLHEADPKAHSGPKDTLADADRAAAIDRIEAELEV